MSRQTGRTCKLLEHVLCLIKGQTLPAIERNLCFLLLLFLLLNLGLGLVFLGLLLGHACISTKPTSE